MRPIVYMITALANPGDEEALVERIGAAARAGVHLIQIRQPEMEGRPLMRLVLRAVEAVRATGARVLVNDRVDVALAAGAHGVHLRADSVPAARVREVAPRGFVIGRSVHTPGECASVARDGGLDYLIFGTVFETTSKPGVVAGGTVALEAACADVALPVVAVGGMTPSRLGAVARAGAAGFAAIGLFADAPIDRLPVTVREACLVFDRP